MTVKKKKILLKPRISKVCKYSSGRGEAERGLYEFLAERVISRTLEINANFKLVYLDSWDIF